jgi:TRAP-type C4-dicarboxylate transport system permease small subunit
MKTNEKGPVLYTGPFLLLMKLVRKIDYASFGAIVFCMGAMTLLVSTQVFLRYVLSSSIDSADELSRLFFVWAIFLAIPHGLKSGIHVGIDVLVCRFNQSLQTQISRLMSFSSAGLMGLVFVITIFVVGDKWQEQMPTLGITAAVYYIAVLIATFHTFLHLVLLAWGGPTIWAEEVK